MSTPLEAQTAMDSDEEEDVSGALKIETQNVVIGDATPETSELKNEEIELYKSAFAALWQTCGCSTASLNKKKILEFCQSVLGPLYSEEIGSSLLEMMEIDENGNVPVEKFDEALSLKCWKPEVILAVHEVIKCNPDFVRNMVDWKSLFGELDVEVAQEDIDDIISEAQKSTAALVESELEKLKCSRSDWEKSSKLFAAIKEKLHLFDLGGKSGPNLASGEPTSSNLKEPVEAQQANSQNVE